ncbi:YitT family protein [Allofustis seminis]|uniref:YitT family protein n=1 Tax=Allofustis seminis TaxID=166939 RepID=UPI00035CDEC4|nr:YitT family protein [Allofustis seminis]
MEKTNQKELIKEKIVSLLQIAVGSFVTAVAFQVFILPNNIIFGGVTSLSIILNALFGWTPAMIQYLINIPLIVLFYLTAGKTMASRTVLGSLLVPFFVSLISHWGPWTHDPLLAAVYGGAVTGIGSGLVFKASASTGGTSIIAHIIHKFFDVSLGMGTLIIDGFVIVAGFLTFNLESILLGILALFILSRVIDVMMSGSNVYKNVMVVSNRSMEIRREIISNFDRGVTQFEARGGFNLEKKQVLMIVIQERQFRTLEEIIMEIDENAFIVVMPASRVLGRGFSLDKFMTTLAEPQWTYGDELDEEERLN